MTLDERQIALEEEMQGLGAKRFWDNIHKAKEGQQEASTVYGTELVKRTIAPLSKALTTYLQEKRLVRGAKSVASTMLREADPDVVAYLTVRAVLNGVTRHDAMQRVAVRIASDVEDEMRFRLFKTEAKALWGVVKRDLDGRIYQEQRKRKVLVHSMNKAAKTNKALEWHPWCETDKYHVGAVLLDLLIASTQLVEIKTFTTTAKRNSMKSEVQATAATLAWIEDKCNRCELMSPMYMPMLVPPKPWTTPTDGGYLLVGARPVRLVKTNNSNYIEELQHHDMPVLYAAVNAVQSTAWRINTEILDVMKAVWDAGYGGNSLPARTDYPLPPKPADITTNEAARVVWKRAASKIHGVNAKLRSKRLQMVKMLYIAEKFQHEDAMYFPHQLDFRGRLYAMPSYLTPQGDDVAKGLLTFAEGKPLGVAGLRWLKIHLANTFGVDKCSLDARVLWTNDHLAEIFATGESPLDNRWWQEAEKPWQFLAACMALCSTRASGIATICSLPVSVDGSCNGLQNFSAMLRDEVGGAATNLVPADAPNDIYQQVADVVLEKVQIEAVDVWSAQCDVARRWLRYGFDRKATKRPVMVLPYGGTLYSSREYLFDYIIEQRQGGKETPWEADDDFTHAAYLAGHVWNSIGEVVIAARSAMGWLQSVAALAAKDGLPVNWTTPAGLPVLQAYKDTRARKVETMLGGRIIQSILREEVDALDKKKQASGISPNFVHSMDAAALMLCVTRCLAAGLTSFGMVHDSYGTVPADMDAMAVCLREAFVEMYGHHDVLEEFRASIAAGLTEEHAALLPPVPQRGSLDLSLVLQSQYFFA